MTFEVTGNNQLDRAEALRINQDRSMTLTASAPMLSVNATNNASGFRVNLQAGHGSSDLIRFMRGGTNFFVADMNSASAQTGQEIWYDGQVRQVGVTNINGAAVLYFPGVPPP
jgi:hypothetical protein